MAVVVSNEYDHIDVVNNSNTNRHYIKDTVARNRIDDLQSAKAPVIIDTASGAIASFEDGADSMPIKALTVNIEPVQDTSGGDPSPTNICPITGWTGCNIHVSRTTTGGTVYPITFPTEAGTVYGGTLDVTSGVLTVDRVDLHTALAAGVWTKNGTFWQMKWGGSLPTLANLKILCDTYENVTPSGTVTQDGIIGFIASGSTLRLRDNSLTTLADVQAKLSNIQAIFQIAEPIVYNLTADEITTLLGTNNIWADCGDVSVEYPADTSSAFSDIKNALNVQEYIANKRITPEQYGAVGDGETDDTTAIASAISNANGKTVLLKNKYLVSSLEITSNLDLVLDNGCEIISTLVAGIGEGATIYAHGSVSETKNTIGAYTQNRISYKEVYSVGDYIELYHYDSDTETYSSRGQYLIQSNTPSYFFLSTDIPYDDVTHSAKITPIKVNIISNNAKIYSRAGVTNTGDYITLSYCIDSTVKGINIKSSRGRGVTATHSFNTQIDNCTWIGVGVNITSQTAPEYEAFLDNCGSETKFNNCKVFNSTSGVDFAGSIHSVANNCELYNARLRTHGLGCKEVEFNNCLIFGDRSNGIGSTFGNLSYSRNDSRIFCNNCHFNGGAYGSYILNGTTDVFFNNCDFKNYNYILEGVTGSAVRGSGLYLNHVSQKSNGNFKVGNIDNIYINGTLSTTTDLTKTMIM